MRAAVIVLYAVLAATATDAAGQQSLAPAVARVAPSVAKITSYGSTPAMPIDPAIEKFFRPNAAAEAERKETGSAFVVDAERGLLVTADYIVASASRLEVELPSGETRPATIVGVDETSGVGLVKIAPGGLTAVAWTDAEPAIGDQAMLTAYAFGLGPLSTTGIVSGRERVEEWKIVDSLFVDIAIHRGAGGGPVTTLEGKVIGMATAQFGAGGNGYVNLGVAIPASEIRPVIDALAKSGKVARSWIGVTADRLPFNASAVILEVVPGTPAERAGLKKDDQIVSVNGIATRDNASLRSVIAKAPIGSTLKMQVRRDDEIREMTVVTEERVDP